MMLKNTTSKISFVTGIWDLDRGDSKPGWKRSFEHYLDNFIRLLCDMKDFNLIIFIDPSLEDLVWQHRSKNNTRVYHHSKDQFKGSFFPFFDKIQEIRNNPEWYNQVGWLKDSTQGSLEYYNPMVMSKMFLLHNAKCYDPFNSEYFYWIDGGLTNTMSLGYFNNPTVIDNLIKLSDNFLFIAFPYETSSEIHGFCIEGMKKYAKNNTVNRVARGGFFGGHKDSISNANRLYYSLLQDTLNDGYMGTEESIFTIMTYLDPSTYHHEMIEDNGLIYYFFEQLQKSNIKFKNKEANLYIITYNSPQQVRMVLDSFLKYDKNFIDKPNKILINNSTNVSYDDEYNEIIHKYNFTEIKRGNLGICGGRQLAAEHFDESNAEYMFFFEDDMLLDYEDKCSFGLSKNVNDLYNNITKIIDKEKYDFVKFSFSEFYGHNGDQWSWHNVPQALREEYFGNIQNKPHTNFNNIKSLNNVPYVDGEVYYSNWPHIISKTGNKKCFIDTKWNYPYEQTWMSHIYTLTKQKLVKPAILLASPITHNRVHHYEKNQRKEN
jgi:hypothetical protein